MNTKDHGRKEPSLSDLDAFEALLRESLHEAPVATAPASAAPAPALSAADRDAMAELTRLIEQPLDFSLPDMTRPVAPPAAPVPPPAPELHTHVEASFTPDWASPPQVLVHGAQVHGAAPEVAPVAHAPVLPASGLPEPLHSVTPEDPLAAFEEELRRFDASRIRVPETAPAPAPDVDFSALTFEPAPAPPLQPDTLVERQRAEEATFQSQQYAPPELVAPPVFAPAPAPAQPSPLEEAERRLAAEAAAASYDEEEPQASDIKRSRGVFVALGLLAAGGLAIVGGTFLFSGPKKSVSGGDVPVITAKREPTKEKPADPGGVEIPNQNAQVLTGRDAIKQTKPAEQVVNTTEQPLDLKEVTRRDSVRIVAPNPFQTPSTPTANDAASGVRPAEVEPRRVTSVRVPVNGESAVPPAASAPSAGAAAGAAAIAAIAAGAAPRAATAAPKADTPKLDTPKADTPKSDARPPKKAEPAKVDAPKVAPTPKVANASSTPKATAPEKAAPRNPKAPMSLTGDKAKDNKANAASGASGTYAIQLASRPTEADARSAAASLGSKYSAQLGGKGARVVSGEANGKAVYRVRAGGYSQASATEACNKIKAAGGACFIAKQ